MLVSIASFTQPLQYIASCVTGSKGADWHCNVSGMDSSPADIAVHCLGYHEWLPRLQQACMQCPRFEMTVLELFIKMDLGARALWVLPIHSDAAGFLHA